MELKLRAQEARDKAEDLHAAWQSGSMSTSQREEYEWLKTEIQLIQAEALTRLAYKSW